MIYKIKKKIRKVFKKNSKKYSSIFRKTFSSLLTKKKRSLFRIKIKNQIFNLLFNTIFKKFHFEYAFNDKYVSFKFSKKKYLYYYASNLHFGHQILELMQFYSICNLYDFNPILNYSNKIKLNYLYNLKIEGLKTNDNVSIFIKYCLWLIIPLFKYLNKDFYLLNNNSKYFNKKIVNKCPNFIIPNENLLEQKIFKTFPIIKNKKIITISVRNDFYYDYLEVGKAIKGYRDERVRNFNSIVYLKAIINYPDYIFVKIGYKDKDFNLDPYNLENYIDLSNSNNFDQSFQYYFVKNSILSIHGDTGTVYFPKLFNVPNLNINCIHPILNYPLKRNQFAVMQKIYKDNIKLNIDNLLTTEAIENVKNPTYYKYINHSQDDFYKIFSTVINKIKNNNYELSKDEKAIKEKIKDKIDLITDIKSNHYNKYMDKWADRNFIGEGFFLSENL
jgi:hypothetical protein